ncbi:hypothetical protein ACF1DY_01740 [Streptomyces albus]
MSRPSTRPHTSHAQVAAQLRAHPGVWMQVSVYRTAYRQPAYEPAGAYEARVQRVEAGTAVLARWLGPEAEAKARRAAALAAVRAGGEPQ